MYVILIKMVICTSFINYKNLKNYFEFPFNHTPKYQLWLIFFFEKMLKLKIKAFFYHKNCLHFTDTQKNTYNFEIITFIAPLRI